MAQKYNNLLHKFRSYSYHHILFVCDSTRTAEAVAKLDKFSEFVSGDRLRTFRGRDSDQPLQSPDGGTGKYLVLINGTTDVDFFIESANWYSILMPRAGTGIPAFAMATEGEIKIIEPQGARFFNVLDRAFDVLGSDPPGLIFMLKTVFVGHTDGEGDVVISDIKPFMIVPYDIISVFDHAGGTYTMRFMGAYNGAIKAPSISKNLQVTVRGDDTIASALTNLEAQLNRKSTETFEQVTKAKADGGSGIQGRRVRYVIVTDPVYGKTSSQFAGAGSKINQPRGQGVPSEAKDYILDNVNSRNTDTGKSANTKKPVFSFGPNENVEQMIDKIMKLSIRAVQEATGKREREDTSENVKGANNPAESNKKKKIWKIYSTVDSDREEYRAVYYVKQFELEEQTDNDVFSGSAKSHSVEFDYIFSGQNIDILEFDMKMEMGLGFLHLLTNTSNSVPDSGVETESVQTGQAPRFLANGNLPAVQTSLKPSRVIRDITPVPPSTNTKGSTMRNAVDSDSMNAFQALMSRWAGYESVEAKMKIHGNPVFLSELTKFPSDILGRLFPQASEEPVPSDGENQFFPAWESKPALVKVNVFMPDPETGALEQFWYQGHYYLYGVNNVFNMGEFTQELDMVALPVSFDPPKRTNAEVQQESGPF